MKSSQRLRSPGCGQKHLQEAGGRPRAALLMLMTRPKLSPLPPPQLGSTFLISVRIRQSHTCTVIFLSNRGLLVIIWDMIWTLVILGAACALLQAASGNRTVAFRRPRRETGGPSGVPRPPHGPPFTSCRIPLTPEEHKVLDDNTHEVRRA